MIRLIQGMFNIYAYLLRMMVFRYFKELKTSKLPKQVCYFSEFPDACSADKHVVQELSHKVACRKYLKIVCLALNPCFKMISLRELLPIGKFGKSINSTVPAKKQEGIWTGLVPRRVLNVDNFPKRVVYIVYPPQKLTVRSENRPSQKENNRIPTIHFQVQAVSFRDGNKKTCWTTPQI